MSALIFVKDLLVATFGQLAALFGGMVVFGLLLQVVSHLTFRSLEKSFGNSGVFVVAWLGTPVHELAHAVFCVLFMHRIEAMSLFSPDPDNGTLGYVRHTWDRRNPWAVLGNFFIGIGPVIIGGGVLFGLFYWLVPGSSGVWNAVSVDASAADFTAWRNYTAVFTDSSLAMVKILFSADNLTSWRFWLFLYLAVCISSNLRLSTADLRGALSGLGCVVIPFLVLNLVALLIGANGNSILPFTAASLGAAYSVFILAAVLGVLGLAVCYPVAAAYYSLRYRHVLSPF